METFPETIETHAFPLHGSRKVVAIQGITFEIGKTLGSGGQGVVKLGTRTDNGDKFALKFIDKAKLSARNLNLLAREVTAQRILGEVCENISTLYACEDNVIIPSSHAHVKPRAYMVLVLELSTGGELLNHLLHGDAFNETLARTYFLQLLSALGTCHSHGIAHRDVKLENVLLDGDTFSLRLCDFGLCSSDGQDGGGNSTQRCSTECGTSRYVAPEVLGNQGRGSPCYSGAKADMWSLGAVLFVMVMGCPPLERPDRSDWYFTALLKNRADRFWQAHNRTVPAHGSPPSELFMDLVSKLLCVDPSRRLSVDEALAHPWTQGFHAASLPVDNNWLEVAGVGGEGASFGGVLTGAQLIRVMATRARAVEAAVKVEAEEEERKQAERKRANVVDEEAAAKALEAILAKDQLGAMR